MTRKQDGDWLNELRDLVPADPPEPWAGGQATDAGLTDEQRAFLVGLADTPPVPRLREAGDHVSESPNGGRSMDPGDLPESTAE